MNRVGRSRRGAAFLATGLAVSVAVAQTETASAPRVAAVEALLEQAQSDLRAGQDDAALRGFEQAELAARALPDLRLEIYAVLGQGDVLRSSGALQRSLEQAERALGRIDGRRQGTRGVLEDELRARVLRQRAQVLSRLGRVQAADDDLRAAAELFSALEQPDRRAGVLATRSVLAAQQGRHADAVRFGRAALAGLPEIQSAEGLGALSSVAYGEHRLGNLDAARTLYEDLIQRAFERGDQRLVLFATCNRAEILRAQGMEARAEDDLRELVEASLIHRDALPVGPDERASAFDLRANAFDQLIGLLFDTWRGAEAFTVAERYRARSFLERAGAGAARLAEASPAAGAVQEVLRDDEALVSYWLLEDRAVVWTLTRERFDQVQIPIARATLQASIRDYLEELRAPALARTAHFLGAEQDHLDLGLQLGRWLIDPLPAIVRSKSRWHVLLDGALHHLPLGAVPLGCIEADRDRSVQYAAYRNCRYLGLEKAVGVVPSAAALLALRARPPVRATRSLVLAPGLATTATEAAGRTQRGLAPVLEGARSEARKIHITLGDSELLEGAAANEAALPRGAQLSFLHLATHGWADAQLPERSGIALSSAEGHDGTLRLDEIVERGLRARLVTLASCASAQGPLRRSEGLLGLARGFLVAGADGVLGSLWNVDDQSTSILLSEFYRFLTDETDDPAEALRLARRAVFEVDAERAGVFRRSQVAYAHPTYWSGFVLIGAP